MLLVKIDTLIVGSNPGASVLMLRPVMAEDNSDYVLPICIGSVEAAAIGKALSGEPSARPMTHALIGNILAQLGGSLSRVVIDKVKGTVFYATLCVQRGTEIIKIDSRPSDAIALAVRQQAPIYVEDSVFEAASYPSWINTPQGQQKVAIEEFHDFVENLSPEDFAWDGPGERGAQA